MQKHFLETYLIASTPKGICHLSFLTDNAVSPEAEIHSRFPAAILEQKTDLLQQEALKMFRDDWSDLSRIKLHLKGTPFQIKVWNALLQIPSGSLKSYSQYRRRNRRSESFPRSRHSHRIQSRCLHHPLPPGNYILRSDRRISLGHRQEISNHRMGGSEDGMTVGG